MKNMFVLFLLACSLNVHSQLKVKPKCDAFTVDILDGRVNDVQADFTAGQITKGLPCFTEQEPASSKCGGMIDYKDRDVKFFPGRDYVEIGPKFKGRMTPPLMGGRRGSFFKWLGTPKMKDDHWDAFQTQYGCLILYYDAASKVRMIRFSTKTTDEINICE